mmetsp:Transcript_35861/g.43178  ORF Transcript_35861/g.43178 Transcript_35861/m.43178 type:complete len:351 (+) Transcript_35861:166-1218(+)
MLHQSIKNETPELRQHVPNNKEKWDVQSTPQKTGLIPTLAVSLWLGQMGMLVCFILYSLISPYTPVKNRMIIWGICLASLVLPRHIPSKALSFEFGGWIVRHAEEYFGLTTVLENRTKLENLDDGVATIYAMEPHDVIPYGMFAFNPKLERIPRCTVLDNAGLVANAIFSLPFIRQVYSAVCCGSVDKRTFVEKLRKGETFVFCPGGAEEVMCMDPANPHEIPIYIKKRKGFVNLALRFGSPIVPVFIFNLDGSYGYWIPKGTIMKRLANAIGFVPLFFWGRFGIPFGIPNPQKLVVVVGSPILLPKEGEGNVNKESVEYYHKLFCDELIALFDRHKDDMGYGDRRLVVV